MRLILTRAVLVCVLLAASFGAAPIRPALATTLPTGFVETRITDQLDQPTAMEIAPDGRIFITEQGGTLRVVKNGQLLGTPFLTVNTDDNGERGLLGVTFDPAFTVNRYLYIYYTVPGGGGNAPFNRVSRFTANGDTAVSGSELPIFDIDPLSSATNHNGGAMHFGVDGKLYIAVGENANPSFAQSMTTLHGKMLRINADGSIPADNPFYSTASGKYRAIWALGLRNPFTFAFSPGSNLMHINDVGSNGGGKREEINRGRAGANYGWPIVEGYTTDPRFDSPVYVYDPSQGCAITGGAFYSPNHPSFPEPYHDKYFFADFCNGWIRTLDTVTREVQNFATNTIDGIVDLKVSDDGDLYYLRRGVSLYRIRYEPSPQPTIVQDPENLTVGIDQTATFSCVGAGQAPLNYQWQRNTVNISGATSPSYSFTANLGDNGAQFRCRVSNSLGNDTSASATLTVLNNYAPSASITTPSSGVLYNAGQTISYSGDGSDPETGNLPASAFTWRVDFHHDMHSHPFIPNTTGSKSGQFTIPTLGETATNVWYRITLTVTDAAGLTTSIYRDINPRVVQVSVNTVPPGLDFTLDGQPKTAPFSFGSVVGIRRTLGTVTQVSGGTTYVFNGWSNGAVAGQEISTPGQNTTLTAFYAPTNAKVEAVGVYRQGGFLLRNSNTTGYSDINTVFGAPNDLPVPGDWNGDGIDTVGVFRPSTGTWYLRNSNAPGSPIAAQFNFGTAGDQPLAGDWNGSGTDGIGVFRPNTRGFFLRNSVSAGAANYAMTFGIASDRPLVGDWNGNGTDGIGVFRPSTAMFYLSNQVCNCAPAAAYSVRYGAANDTPFTGDWNGDGTTGLGVFRPAQGLMHLRNNPTTNGPADITLRYGMTGDKPIAGRWSGNTQSPDSAPEFVPGHSGH